jgi:hypothetical protein
MPLNFKSNYLLLKTLYGLTVGRSGQNIFCPHFLT